MTDPKVVPKRKLPKQQLAILGIYTSCNMVMRVILIDFSNMSICGAHSHYFSLPLCKLVPRFRTTLSGMDRMLTSTTTG